MDTDQSDIPSSVPQMGTANTKRNQNNSSGKTHGLGNAQKVAMIA